MVCFLELSGFRLEEAGTRGLPDAAELAKEQAVTQTQQAETKRMLSQQLSVVTKHCLVQLEQQGQI